MARWTSFVRLFLLTLTFAGAIGTFAPNAMAALPSVPGLTKADDTDDKAAKDKEAKDSDTDKVAPDSPRAAWLDFKAACNDGRFVDAARHLDLARTTTAEEGARLAEHLDTVLRHYLGTDEEDLSPLSQGDANDGLPPGVDGIGIIPRRDTGGGDPVRMIRRTEADGTARWVFVRTVVDRIPKWYEHVGGGWIRDHVPRPLWKRGPLDVPYWELLLLPLTVMIAYLLGLAVERAARPLVIRAVARLAGIGSEELTAKIRAPARLLWTLLLCGILKQWVVFDLSLASLTNRILEAAGVLGFAWTFNAVLDVSVLATQRLSLHVTPGFRGAFALLGKIGTVAVWILASIATLSILGYPVGSILAGLGIGGLALALAAQKTVENLFGCVSIGVDQPFRVGDFIVVDGVRGNVEYLGLRSTRIRTVDRTVVTIPNGKLADMRIENFAVRDRFRFHAVFPLAQDTAYLRIRTLMGEAQRILEEIEGVVKGDIEVNFKEISKDSIDLEFVATVRAASFPAFRERKHATIFALLERLNAGGMRLARPVVMPVVAAVGPAPAA